MDRSPTRPTMGLLPAPSARRRLELCAILLLGLAASCDSEKKVLSAPEPDPPDVVDAGAPPADGERTFEETGPDADVAEPEQDQGGIETGCKSNSECIGKVLLEVCKKPVCNAGKCSLAQSGENVPCDDGDPCTVDSTCSAGKCQGGSPLPCEDKSPCTKDICDAVLGCRHNPQGGACDDGNPCTLADHCQDGACVSGNSVCPCETDADCAKWEDDDLCNGSLFCQSKVCKIDTATTVKCPTGDAGQCQVLGCNPATGQCGAVPLPDGIACTDGSICTSSDQCHGGQCKGGAPACPCTDDDSCLLYDDGDLCNGRPICIGGQCVADPTSIVVCPGQGNPCSPGACDPKTGECTAQPKDGVACDDGDPCTAGDTCAGGGCAGTTKSCDDGNPCTDDACVESGQKAGSCENTPNGAPCDDGDACTVGDACAGGVCAAGKDECSCEKHIDCLGVAQSDLCKGEMSCAGGKCVALWPVVCDASANTDCQASQCQPKTGTCQPVPINEGAPCFAGDPCAEGAVCKAGLCTGGTGSCACAPGDMLKCNSSLPWANYAYGSSKNVDAWTCAAGDYTGPEYAFVYKSTTAKAVSVKLGSETGSTAVFVVEEKGGGCLPSGCIASHPSKLTFVAEANKIYYVVVDGKNGSQGKFDIAVTCSAAYETQCGDGWDNDGDGAPDCADSDCAGEPSCQGKEDCGNLADDDGDGNVDCLDPDCVADVLCESACYPSGNAYCGLSTFWQTDGYGSANDVEVYGCETKPYDSPELVYEYHATKTTTATVLLEQSFPGHKIFVMQDQGAGCNGANCIQSGAGQVQFTAVLGMTYYIAIDGAGGMAGDYKIKITCE